MTGNERLAETDTDVLDLLGDELGETLFKALGLGGGSVTPGGDRGLCHPNPSPGPGREKEEDGGRSRRKRCQLYISLSLEHACSLLDAGTDLSSESGPDGEHFDR